MPSIRLQTDSSSSQYFGCGRASAFTVAGTPCRRHLVQCRSDELELDRHRCDADGIFFGFGWFQSDQVGCRSAERALAVHRCRTPGHLMRRLSCVFELVPCSSFQLYTKCVKEIVGNASCDFRAFAVSVGFSLNGLRSQEHITVLHWLRSSCNRSPPAGLVVQPIIAASVARVVVVDQVFVFAILPKLCRQSILRRRVREIFPAHNLASP
mmetsp:Transcript_27014/g.63740  ORF Transcript_27014/g.63740 Transcript_27014/m.63740 type:complete len:210 (-) Transcript_27014:2-631(-)